MKFYRREGQHILVDRRVLSRIVRYAELSKSDAVLEVGCGTGNLTSYLLKSSGVVYGIEKDRRFVDLLKKKFSHEISENRFVLIEGDALRVEWPEFNKFVSNIPYNISSELTFRLLEHKFDLAVVMYQKEFAERLVAREGSKSYGRLSVMVKAFCRAEILEIVRPSAFRPRPKVESAIVRLYPEPEIAVRDVEKLDLLLRAAFSSRRKKFGKVLRSLGVDCDVEGYEDERPENIPPEVYARLSECL
ncbi:ribosomal RNA small subunit methyltransferase A [Geoglobus ahangari]|uniref:Probable ribosomal RNA small subunit methyltransferase A n=1 Tax=Geoglobus ahangari TaxID=113653 RepID=A0A0F7IFH4_9EURY|nr:16S rRNA (adenine(1518)-N(6)/adenine(1519)-N(6))-dimethyltransferase RsmA [Geoglobus ahangari]AKG91604.1 ribosomal RNA small subunit methyltransferase A [Geoglobus ahangari]